MVRASCSSLKAQRSSMEPPPAHQQDDVDLPAAARTAHCSAPHEFGRRLRALHRRRRQHHRDVRHAAAQRSHHVVQRRRAQRSHQADAARQRRHGALARRVEQALRPPAAPSAAGTARTSAPCPRPAQAFDDQLQVAARLVDAEPAAHLDLIAVARREIQQAGRAAEHGAAELALCVLQREVAMPAGRAREARNLPAHRDRIEARIQRIRNGAAKRANCPDSRRQMLVLASRSIMHMRAADCEVDSSTRRRGMLPGTSKAAPGTQIPRASH